MTIHLPKLTFREWMSAAALAASVIGCAVLTAFSAVLVWIMWHGGWPDTTAPERIDVLSKALMFSLAGSFVVLITLGFVINQRTIKIGPEGLEASGGSDDSLKQAITNVPAHQPQQPPL